jgi:tetratricopeptide (TPR) repeat protein
MTFESDSVTAPGSGSVSGIASGTAIQPDSLQPGQKFGARYTILKKLGAGGMGAVYQAFDDSLGVAVALKVIRLDSSTSSEETRQLEARFKRELLLARQVTHPNVVRIHDLGELGPTKYLTMAYVEGADLSTVLKREGKLPVERALSLMKQVAEGLSAAHNAGVVHRDLKPANVMIDGEGRALLTDFGIARSIDAATLHTVPGSIVGTLDYMSPEQARGETVDRRSDVYSLGLILYEMLAGGRPRLAGGGLADLLARVQNGPPPIGSVAPDVPPPLQQIVARSLERDPDARYASAGEFLADLNRLAPDGRTLLTAVLPPPPVPRSRTALLAACAVLFAVMLAVGGWWMLGNRSPAAPAAPREPVSVLIADFENRAGDPLFTGTLEQALAIGMEGAPFVSNFSRSDAAKIGQTIKAGSALDASLAQLVAVRQEIGVVLAGSVAQESGGYVLQVRALRPGSGTEPFATVTERAPDKTGVLRAVDGLATQLRKALGDTPPAATPVAENVSVASLEALREYTIAQDLSTDRKNEEAIQHYKAAPEKDPQFGRAYAGWAVAAFDLGRHDEAQELWKKALERADRMTEREQYRTFGGYYLGVARNYDQAIDNYTKLVEKYPADLAGQSNLALAYFFKRNFDKAFEYGKRAIDTYPDSLKSRNNYALYAMYAGQFKTAADNAAQVLAKDPKYDAAYLPLAMAAFSDGDLAKAREIYGQARDSGPSGASLAAIGLADIALYEGKPADAVTILEAAIAADRDARNTLGVSTKTVALAEARAALSGPAAATPLLTAFLDSSDEYTAVPSARILAAAKQDGRARALARKLEERSQPEARAYARIIEGEVALQQGRYSDAISAFAEAVKNADLWLARFGLGIAYVEAKRAAEAIAELKACENRRGEATALFFDDIPTYRYTAVLPYWRGRAQEGMGQSAAAAASFEEFLKIRSAAKNDPLVADAQKRLAALRAP